MNMMNMMNMRLNFMFFENLWHPFALEQVRAENICGLWLPRLARAVGIWRDMVGMSRYSQVVFLFLDSSMYSQPVPWNCWNCVSFHIESFGSVRGAALAAF